MNPGRGTLELALSLEEDIDQYTDIFNKITEKPVQVTFRSAYNGASVSILLCVLVPVFSGSLYRNTLFSKGPKAEEVKNGKNFKELQTEAGSVAQVESRTKESTPLPPTWPGPRRLEPSILVLSIPP